MMVASVPSAPPVPGVYAGVRGAGRCKAGPVLQQHHPGLLEPRGLKGSCRTREEGVLLTEGPPELPPRRQVSRISMAS